MEEGIRSLPRCYSTPAGIELGPLDVIADGSARGVGLAIAQTRFHGFVVRRGGSVRGYVDRCPHAGLPLAQTLDGYLTADGGLIQCSWHGALFSIEDGACVGGPCPGRQLICCPLDVRDGVLVTA